MKQGKCQETVSGNKIPFLSSKILTLRIHQTKFRDLWFMADIMNYLGPNTVCKILNSVSVVNCIGDYKHSLCFVRLIIY